MGAKPENAEDAHRLEVNFMTSAPSLAQCPTADGPEVAFAGRSNAGKSSVLNRLTGNRHTAKVSKTPGRTQLLNFFSVAGGGRIVDLPGYGYAKAARSAQQEWQRNVNEFLSLREQLSAVVLVTDIRHPGQPHDEELLVWASASEIPVLLLLNKADKLKRNAQHQALQSMLHATKQMPVVQVALFSTLNGLGTNSVIEILRGWLHDP